MEKLGLSEVTGDFMFVLLAIGRSVLEWFHVLSYSRVGLSLQSFHDFFTGENVVVVATSSFVLKTESL